MGNTQGTLPHRPVKTTDASAMFHALDVSANGYLTIKDLMDSPAQCLMMLHSLPALYFFDKEKNGRLTESEFTSLVLYCQREKQKVEETLLHDKNLRDLILRASKAGVKDCSMHGRTSYRRLSSYCNIRSVFSSRRSLRSDASDFTSISTMSTMSNTCFSNQNRFSDPQHVRSNTVAVPYTHSVANVHPPKEVIHEVAACSASFDNTDGCRISYSPARFSVTSSTAVAMFSAEPDLHQDPLNSDCSEEVEFSGAACSDPDLLNPQNRTAIDVAVLENIISSSIHRLADLLHTDGSREKFMSWLWKLADFNGSGVVTLEELRIFLAALSEDGIDLGELVFHREDAEPMEVCIINEFDTTHAGMLSKDEFMVLADLVTREYEFWENRHLDRIGDYELGRTIGRGSSGIVRLAMHVETREKYAIKIIKKGKCSDLSRLDREIQSLMAAKHKHIVALEEVLDSENNIFIVMELCGGGSMIDIVRLYPEERMPEETARFFMRQVFEALAFCHDNGICHRDIRLDNLMLDNCGNAKITDFGHSGLYTPGWDIFSTSLVGSVYNLSPEQVTGQVYSGEKIDIWSAGVAVFCLLVGRPPFYDPDVNTLLEKIPAGNYEVPDFVSPAAKRFIECMIRPVPEERISICQMLHHEWFYDGPEHGPSMNVVMFPVDTFFKKRPDIAEMILAITIYQHSLHFHLADTQNPHSSPNELRGQDWTLRCLCPKNDIKFTVSLFTRKPHSLRKPNLPLPEVSSALTLSPSASVDGGIELNTISGQLGEVTHCRAASITGFQDVPSNFGVVTEQKTCSLHMEEGDDSLMRRIPRTSRPPLQRRTCKVTPMNIAARLREASSTSGRRCADPFDFDPTGREDGMMVQSFREDLFYGDRSELTDKTDSDSSERRTCHTRSQSLDGISNVRRVNRSAKVDAFPYHKVYPQREMPESARNLNFGKPESGMDRSVEDVAHALSKNSTEMSFRCLSAPITPTFEHPSFGDGRVLPFGELALQSPSSSAAPDEEIAEEISRHPLKTISPQVAQLSMSELPADRNAMVVSSDAAAEPVEGQEGVTDCDGNIKTMGTSTLDRGDSHRDSCSSSDAEKRCSDTKMDDDGMQPFIEVRLLGGEAGLFLKICRKLKGICETKLAAAAQRQKSRTCGRRTLTALRRTASARCGGHARTAA